ncbi:MAG: 30S ribosomal protein S20 [Patescibacteria group bacterium]
MPITKSAKKALRKSLRMKAMNLRRKEAYKNTLKKFIKLAAEGKNKEAEQTLPKVYKSLDKAAKTNVIAKNKASRLKSKAQRLLQKTA